MERDEAINAVSGAVAGVVTAVFVCPLDVLKTRLQVRGAGGAVSSYAAVRFGLYVREDGSALPPKPQPLKHPWMHTLCFG